MKVNERFLIGAIKVLVTIGAGGFIATIATYYGKGLINSGNISSAQIGALGSFISGCFGTLFVLATTALVWLTYITQKKELQESRQLINKQRFEDTFFNMISVQQELKRSITFELLDALTYYVNDGRLAESKIVTGDAFFNFAMGDFQRLYQVPEQIVPGVIRITDSIADVLGEYDPPPVTEPMARIVFKYKEFFTNYHYQLGHYFRHLYYILVFIEKAEADEITLIPERKKEIFTKYKFYAGMVQAQLSSSELFLLFYDGLIFPKMNKMIKKYGLLNNLPYEDLADPERHKNLYGENTIGSRYKVFNQPALRSE